MHGVRQRGNEVTIGNGPRLPDLWLYLAQSEPARSDTWRCLEDRRYRLWRRPHKGIQGGTG